MKQIDIKLIVRVLPYIALFIASSILMVKCTNEKAQSNTIEALQAENKTYKLKNNQLVLSKEVAFLDNKQMKAKIKNLELASKFSKVTVLTKFVNVTRIDSINVLYKDSIPCVFEKTGDIVDKNYSLAYKSNQLGLVISKLEIPDSLVIVTGIKRKWFLGKTTTSIDITHSNPLVKSSDLQNFELKDKKMFYETKFFNIGVGFIAGFLLMK